MAREEERSTGDMITLIFKHFRDKEKQKVGTFCLVIKAKVHKLNFLSGSLIPIGQMLMIFFFMIRSSSHVYHTVCMDFQMMIHSADKGILGYSNKKGKNLCEKYITY